MVSTIPVNVPVRMVIQSDLLPMNSICLRKSLKRKGGEKRADKASSRSNVARPTPVILCRKLTLISEKMEGEALGICYG